MKKQTYGRKLSRIALVAILIPLFAIEYFISGLMRGQRANVIATIMIVCTALSLYTYHQQMAEDNVVLPAVPVTVDTATYGGIGNYTPMTVAEGSTGTGESTLQGIDYKTLFSHQAITMMAQTLYGEADGVASDSERSMVIWCILNRYDSGIDWFGTTIGEIISKPNQFTGYRAENPVTERNLVLVKQVIFDYIAEKEGYPTPIGRTLPSDVYFFHAAGNGINHNIFYKMSDGALGGERVYFGYTPLCTAYDNY